MYLFLWLPPSKAVTCQECILLHKATAPAKLSLPYTQSSCQSNNLCFPLPLPAWGGTVFPHFWGTSSCLIHLLLLFPHLANVPLNLPSINPFWGLHLFPARTLRELTFGEGASTLKHICGLPLSWVILAREAHSCLVSTGLAWSTMHATFLPDLNLSGSTI